MKEKDRIKNNKEKEKEKENKKESVDKTINKLYEWEKQRKQKIEKKQNEKKNIPSLLFFLNLKYLLYSSVQYGLLSPHFPFHSVSPQGFLNLIKYTFLSFHFFAEINV